MSAIGTIEVFFAETTDLLAEYSRLETYIEKNEKLRAEKLRIKEDRETFLVCHALLRRILAKKLNTCPAGINFTTDINMKPGLPGNPLFFNISHTREAFAFAVTEHSEVGIDLEKADRNFDFKPLIRRFFSSRECEFILESPEESRDRFFFLWTRKEALLKAAGTGITENLSQSEVLESEYVTKYFGHYLYTKRVLDYFISVATPQKAKIVFHCLDNKTFKNFL